MLRKTALKALKRMAQTRHDRKAAAWIAENGPLEALSEADQAGFQRWLTSWASYPDMAIGPPGDTYLQRWYVVPRNRWPFGFLLALGKRMSLKPRTMGALAKFVRVCSINIYFHRFLRSDDERALHDHPWAFNFSWLLDGDYIEHVFTRRPRYYPTSKMYVNGYLPDQQRSIVRKAGAMKLRIGRAPHRVELMPDYIFPQTQKGFRGLKPVWTLFITGWHTQRWGFYCPKGWKDADDFLAMDDDTRHGAGFSKIGRGCD